MDNTTHFDSIENHNMYMTIPKIHIVISTRIIGRFLPETVGNAHHIRVLYRVRSLAKNAYRY
eukprot:SAG31_NODE_59_length_29571_cov_20.443506_35_plen_62_part_00